MDEEICLEILEYKKFLRSILNQVRSSYNRVSDAASEEEKAIAYRECDALVSQLSDIDYGKIDNMVIPPNSSCTSLIEEIHHLEKVAQDLQLKLRLRLSIISKELSKIEETRTLRLEDMKEELKIKMEHLQFLEKDLSKIYSNIGKFCTREELRATKSHLSEIKTLLHIDDSEEISLEDVKILKRERETLLALVNFLDYRIETKDLLLRDLELIGAENVANRERLKVEQIRLEVQEIAGNLEQAPKEQHSKDDLQRIEWVLEGIEIEDYLSIPQLYNLLKDELDLISWYIQRIRKILEEIKPN
ncbi:MAG: hypothetical protein ACFFB3_01095 [Candidatus Hodarchaeota archaeon]